MTAHSMVWDVLHQLEQLFLNDPNRLRQLGISKAAVLLGAAAHQC